MQPTNRSYLFVPGTRPDRFQKALDSGAHAAIIDLEDGVAPSEKDSARQAVAGWLNPEQRVVLRVNGVESEWFREDAALCAGPGLSAVMLPKAETADGVRAISGFGTPGLAILPQIESARGIANALEIAKCDGVERLVFGSLDFQVDLGIDGEDEQLLYFRSQLVLVSRLADILPPVDGITTATDDPDLVRADTERGRRLGFGGKLCIHPKQVSVVNECFRPTAEKVAWASKVVEAAAASGGGAITVDGKMVDRPIILTAERILSESGRGDS